jgi:hypothetical protein
LEGGDFFTAKEAKGSEIHEMVFEPRWNTDI